MSGKLAPSDVDTALLTEGAKIRKLADGGGLFLQVDAKSKVWRFRYTRAGRDALMSLGVYPAVSLESARSKAASARAVLGRGEDPQAARQKERDQRWLETAKTFGVVSAEYNATLEHLTVKTAQRAVSLRNHGAKLHGRTFTEIDRPMLLQCCRVVEQTGKHETAHRLGTYFSRVFRYARDEGYYKGIDPTLGGFGSSLKPVQETHHPAIVEPRQVGTLMRVIDNLGWLDTGRGPVTLNTSRALQLLARVVVRPGIELAGAEWLEFDLDGARHDGHPTWVIPKRRMKVRDGNRVDHIIPLSRQAVTILQAQRELTGGSKYVFVNARTDQRPMTNAALSVAMVALEYKGQHVPHGFRTTFKTLSLDTLKVEMEIVERQLAHKWGSDVAGAYDKAQRLDERRALMQSYSDLLDKLRDAP